MKFTKKEIDLCKQIAEKKRKDLKIGMYVWRKFDKTIQLIYRLDKEDEEIYTVILKGEKLNHLYWNNLEGGWLTPLWTISDCLEFLRERGYWARMDVDDYGQGNIWIFSKKIQLSTWQMYPNYSAKTPLEACLKAVLAVLEDKLK
ncbi:hypothetical protein ES703_87977 [subsurface metagenome]